MRKFRDARLCAVAVTACFEQTDGCGAGPPIHEHKLTFVLEQSTTVSWPSVALLRIV